MPKPLRRFACSIISGLALPEIPDLLYTVSFWQCRLLRRRLPEKPAARDSIAGAWEAGFFWTLYPSIGYARWAPSSATYNRRSIRSAWPVAASLDGAGV